jgi:anti-sigma regulatory factor (Ser/Thr protein kinase)
VVNSGMAHASQAGMPEGRARDLVLAVHQLAANAVRHVADQASWDAGPSGTTATVSFRLG